MPSTPHRPSTRIARYALTAGAAAAVDLGGFVALVGLGLWVAPAAALSFLVATVVNFALTSRFVFADRSGRGYPAFLMAASVGFAVNVAVTTLMTAQGLPPAPAKLIGIGTAFFSNFAMNAAFVFPGPRARAAQTDRAATSSTRAPARPQED